MRKNISKYLITTLIFVLSFTCLYGCNNKNKNLTTVKLNEVVRSVFYAPMYVAINEGFFKEEGIDIKLSTGQGADKTITNTQVNKRGLPR